jgi:hypothetical protein
LAPLSIQEICQTIRNLLSLKEQDYKTKLVKLDIQLPRQKIVATL